MLDFKEDYNQGLVPPSSLFFSTSAVPFYHQAKKKMRIYSSVSFSNSTSLCLLFSENTQSTRLKE